MTHRKILHLDLDAFYCAVEEQRDPSLRDKAFTVGGRPETRGVVASCSYPARKYGVRSAMPMARAVKLCPHLVVVKPRYKAYSKASRRIRTYFLKLTPLVEQISIDEAYLEVTDLPGSGEFLARQLQSTINEEVGLPCSIGVATNKLVAKIATNFGKAAAQTSGSPNAIQVVPPGREAVFLAPLPTEALWGVGPKMASQLANLGIHTIGDIVRYSDHKLEKKFGKIGRALARRSRGIDNSKIVTSHTAKSLSRETTFARDERDEKSLFMTLEKLSDSVSRRLIKKRLAGTTIKLKLRWSDFTTLTRQNTLPQPTYQSKIIFNSVTKLFTLLWEPGRAVRLLGVGVSGLGPPIRQLSLWENSSEIERLEKESRLKASITKLRERYGDQVLQWGIASAEDENI